MKPLHLFLFLTFALFLIGFAIVGVLISVDGPNYLVVLVQIAMAWTPTMAFALIHHKVDADRSLQRHIGDLFEKRIRLLPLLASILIPVIATVVVWIGYSLVSDLPPATLVADLTAAGILLMFADTLIRGPLGEELGWRGYLQNELSKRFSLLRASLIVGVIWGLWHLPLWFVSGYQGADLLLYIAAFFVGLVAFSVIIGFVYGRGRNLLYAILLHQMLNFSGRLLEIDELIVLAASSAIYVIIALAISMASLRSTSRLKVAEPSRVIGKSA
jgi:membrane protease YdiL (CAAX protease family)